MTKKVPTVITALLGEECYVTDFVQVDNPELSRIAVALKAWRQDSVRGVFDYICKQIKYPLNFRGKPAVERRIKLFKWWNGLYLFDEYTKYGWLTPGQTIRAGYGICIDTACLCTSLLRVLGHNAYVCLGAMLESGTRRMLGLHAWSIVEIHGEWHVLETTVHPGPAPIIPLEVAYTGRWKITYDEAARFNEIEYSENPEKVKAYAKIFKPDLE